MNKKTAEFIEEHLEANIHSLALQAARFPDVDFAFALKQLAGMQKIKDKVPTFYENRSVLYPTQLSVEQSSSEITANYKASLSEGDSLADLTGGFGVDTYFLSDRFWKVLYVEAQEELCLLAQHNFSVLGRENIEVLHDTAENVLLRPLIFDWIYLDPARRDKKGYKTVYLQDCLPNVITINDLLLERSEKVLIKLSPMIDIHSLIKDLRFLSEIHIVAVKNECKEVLVKLDKNSTAKITVIAVNYIKEDSFDRFEFFLEEEELTTVNFTSAIKSYLYEPNAAIMKSGSFKLVAARFNLNKLHPNSHLYTSNDYAEDFPGRKFRVIKCYGVNKKEIRMLQSEIKSANLSVRNFSETVEVLRKRLKLKDGGEDYIFATTLADNSRCFIHCRKAYDPL